MGPEMQVRFEVLG